MPVVVAQVISDAARTTKGITPSAQIDADVPADLAVLGTREGLDHVVQNLIDNAIKYGGGTPVTVHAERVDGHIRISVADRGPGLPGGAEKRVFEKFFRAHPVGEPSSGGVGLGLTICRGIVEAHGGQITAANRSGGGAVFEVTLPIGGTPPAVDAAV